MRAPALALALLLAACASVEPAPTEPARAASEPTVEPVPELLFPATPSLDDVLRRVESAPDLAVARAAAAAREGLVEQADLPPNPVAGLAQSVEPAHIGDGRRKTSVSAMQRIETAGKRDARVAVARAGRDEAAASIEVERLRVAGAAALAHRRALAAEALAAAERDALEAADASLELVRRLVDAGRERESAVPPLLARVGRLRVAVADAERERRSALRRLEGLLDLPAGSVTGVTGELGLATKLPPTDGVDFSRHPEVLALRAAEETARCRTVHEEALATPDVTVGLGVESVKERDGGANTVGVSVEMPLAVFDENQGAIRAAREEERRAKARTRAAVARLRGAYAEALEEIASLRANWATWKSEILPALERDFALAQAAHRAGRTGRAPVLAAREARATARVDLAKLDAELSARIVDALLAAGRLCHGRREGVGHVALDAEGDDR